MDGFIGTASGIAGFKNINAIVGGNNTDTVNGLNTDSLWTITGANTVTYTNGNIFNVTAFETLVGGSANDTLTFATFGDVTLTGLGAVDGFTVIEASFTGEFRNINTILRRRGQ